MGRKYGEKKKKDDDMQKKKKQEDNLKKKKEYEVFGIIAKEVFLKRLAKKSDVGRCRCVCKKWRRYLSTTEFGRMHLQYHQVTIDDYKLLVVDESDPSFPFRTLSLDETLPRFKPGPLIPPVSVVATVDGLVCLGVHPKGTVGLTLLFMNPLSGVCKRLPRIPDPPEHTELTRLLTAYDPMGLYLDSCNNDYKLFCLFTGSLPGAVVYSHRLDSWREIEFSLPGHEQRLYWSPPTFYAKSLYFWVLCSAPPGGCFFAVGQIIRFDVNTETFKVITPPPPVATSAKDFISGGLLVFKGCLRLYQCYNIDDAMEGVEVWRFKDDDDFEKLHHFKRRRKKKVLLMCTEAPGDWLAVLDQRGNSFKKMSTDNFTSRYPCFSPAREDYAINRRIYVQTLVHP